ncbi:MAG: RCC1 repeat-containing protein, partial [Ilumatobacteraceae bacterium]|nr:RCC1 repeat-containing protein [Ilumatobacteraceae bacterium]
MVGLWESKHNIRNVLTVVAFVALAATISLPNPAQQVFADANATSQAITAGDHHSCALLSTGAVKCWGNNNKGQLGDGTTDQRNTPTAVSGLSSGVTAITAGGPHSCALLSTGAVKCWGSNQFGQLGDGTYYNKSSPTAVSGLSSGVTAITAGNSHSCALLSTGAVKCWGYAASGQLGNNYTTGRTIPDDVFGLSSGVTAITAGENHSCALLSTGAVKCWGDNQYEQLGIPNIVGSSKVPIDVSGSLSGVTAITGDNNHSCALLSTGAVKCWGYNHKGQLGDGSTTQRNTPTDVSLLSGVTAITAGGPHSCALLSTGAVKCWGNNQSGQLGDTYTTNQSSPTDVFGLSSGVTAITAGISHSCALLSGAVKCWGYNYYGQLGDTYTTNQSSPTDVFGLALAAPAFTLSSSSETKTQNVAIGGYTISSTGGTIASYAISPAAPAGLSFSTSTGLLSGTPTTVQTATAYTITA